MIRIGIAGAGAMGSSHARVLSSIAPSQLVAIVDPDMTRAAQVAASVGAGHFSGIECLIGAVDAAIIATPSEAHADTAIPLLEAGIDLLVEKPLADTVEGAKRIADAARRNGRILMVGHVERFNPAVMEVHRLISSPIHLRFSRVGPFSPRISSDVILDLMVHDLDIALDLIRSPLATVSAVGHRVRTDTYDMVSALLTFESGASCSLTASRIGQNKIREITVTQLENTINVDLLRQDVTIHRIHQNEYVNNGVAVYRQSGLVEIPILDTRGEPLALELRHFLDCLQSRKHPRVGGPEGLRALEAVEAVQTALAGERAR